MKIERNKLIILVLAGLFGLTMVTPHYVGAQSETQAEPGRIVWNEWSGKFEIGVHFSFWTLNLLKGMFQDTLNEELGEEIRDEITSDLNGYLTPSDFEQSFVFDSGGTNFGLDLRYYPQGREGPFSFGLSFDKASMKVSIDGDVRQNYTDGSYAQAEAGGEVVLNPFFTTVSFRWDFMPRWRVTPFFIMGLGIAAMNGELNYEYSGVYKWSGPDETIGDSDQKTFQEAEEEMSVNIPNVLPLLQLNFGLRAEITPQLHLKLVTGIWDGFIVRLGISGRF